MKYKVSLYGRGDLVILAPRVARIGTIGRITQIKWSTLHGYTYTVDIIVSPRSGDLEKERHNYREFWIREAEITAAEFAQDVLDMMTV